MITDVHARIHAFLQQQTVEALPPQTPPQEDAFYNKAGVIPYSEGTTRRFLVMKPVPKHAHMPPPAYQLCKGTRMFKKAKGWRDIRVSGEAAGEIELLATTALREGMEELGLKPEKLSRLVDMGPYQFSSTKTATPRHMWLFAGRMEDENDLLPMAAIAKVTSARAWLTVEQFAAEGREDHRAILADIDARLNKL